MILFEEKVIFEEEELYSSISQIIDKNAYERMHKFFLEQKSDFIYFYFQVEELNFLDTNSKDFLNIQLKISPLFREEAFFVNRKEIKRVANNYSDFCAKSISSYLFNPAMNEVNRNVVISCIIKAKSSLEKSFPVVYCETFRFKLMKIF